MQNKQQNQQKLPSYVPDWAKSLVLQASQKYGMPASLLAAQIEHESGFNPVARGQNTGSVDRGIAQINNYWHPEVSDAQADNPAWAIDWMAKNMSQKFQQYGSWTAALSAYNTGDPSQGVNTYANKILAAAGGQQDPQQQQQAAAPQPVPGAAQPVPMQQQVKQVPPGMGVPQPMLQGGVPSSWGQQLGGRQQSRRLVSPDEIRNQLSALGAPPSQAPQRLPQGSAGATGAFNPFASMYSPQQQLLSQSQQQYQTPVTTPSTASSATPVDYTSLFSNPSATQNATSIGNLLQQMQQEGTPTQATGGVGSTTQ